jgi:hypothetical protein
MTSSRLDRAMSYRRGVTRSIVRAMAAATVTVLAVSPAPAASVKEIFEKHNLLGTFAWDCSKPASKDGNWYYVTRVLDADHVQRDFMTGPTTREWALILDKAAEPKPNEVSFSGTLDGKPVEGLWRLEEGRVHQWSSSENGKKLIGEGRLLSSGREMPWLYRCGD